MDTNAKIACCKICLLAENMKDCKVCQFNIGLMEIVTVTKKCVCGHYPAEHDYLFGCQATCENDGLLCLCGRSLEEAYNSEFDDYADLKATEANARF